MSLLSSAFERFIVLDKRTVSDGQGGFDIQWVDGAVIDCSVSREDSTEARIAAHQGVKNLYTITTRKSVVLMYNDVVRRMSDGKTFRVTSDGAENATPNSSPLNIRQVSAEEWSVPI